MENKLTPKMLQELYPECFWAVYRMGRQEALADPATRKQIAEEYLKNSLTQPSPTSVTSRPSPSLPREGSPAGPVAISAAQAAVNRALGVSDETFVKYVQS